MPIISFYINYLDLIREKVLKKRCFLQKRSIKDVNQKGKTKGQTQHACLYGKVASETGTKNYLHKRIGNYI